MADTMMRDHFMISGCERYVPLSKQSDHIGAHFALAVLEACTCSLGAILGLAVCLGYDIILGYDVLLGRGPL